MSKKPRPKRTKTEKAPSMEGAEGARDEIVGPSSGRILVLAEKAEAGNPPPDRIPLLPLRSDVVFPQTVVPLVVNRPAGIKLIDEVMGDEKVLGMIAQRHPETDEPTNADL